MGKTMPTENTDNLLENIAVLKPQRQIAFKSGYVAESSNNNDDEVLSIKAPDGKICLNITVTPDGPIVEIFGVSLKVATQGDLSLSCRNMSISAENELSIRSKGDMNQIAGGDLTVKTQGKIDTEGFSQNIKARLGDIEMEANDDVRLDGERIRLNSPRPPLCSELRKR